LFEIAETATFQKGPAASPVNEQRRIRTKLAHYAYPILRMNPFSGPNIKCLSNYEPTTWRYRIGSYRIFYEVHGSLVFITEMQQRRDAYK
jgi:mRNA interferase RelE/StbE